MQNSETSLTPIPDQNANAKNSQSERERPVSDKNRVDPIARSSEPGRKGEESTYVPPSNLHPERSTAQTAFDNPLKASSGGGYGLDHFLDKGAVADATLEQASEQRPAMDKEPSGERQALATNIKQQLANTASRFSQTVKGRATQVDGSVRRKPYVYALGAIGAGILAGRFLKMPTR